ncbi:MAG: thioredoxin-dependent thiol peroxidase [Candidatus Pacebacteria bacterium]|nr:thioredoxin-dependent thiol peroxidase [Candidatus Paceibacterota bacterium]
MPSMLSVGQQAPDFTLPDQDKVVHRLTDYRGKWVLIYFYPKDDTPGCTKEACSLRDDFPTFSKLNAQIFGVSADTVASHKKFAMKYKLPFTLLADPEKGMLKAYGVWGKKKFMGREYEGISRSSYLVDPQGKIVKVYEKVNPLTHADEVRTDLEAASR